tara:strand:- start:123 stop:299 length:177 start_codon:yes stop_codon:yes gene_type:complete
MYLKDYETILTLMCTILSFYTSTKNIQPSKKSSIIDKTTEIPSESKRFKKKYKLLIIN